MSMNTRHPTTTETNIEASDLVKLLGGAAAGALLMYMLDPDRGGARRASSTAAIRNAGSRTGSVLGNAVHGIGERIGLAAREAGDTASDLLGSAGSTARDYMDEAGTRTSRMLESAKPNGSARRTLDDTMDSASRMAGSAADSADAAASRLGRLASQAAGSVMGALNVHGRDDLSSLLRNPAVVGGGLLGLFGLMRRSPVAAALGLAGLALAARSGGGQGLSNLLGLGGGRGQSIELEKSIRIDASPDEVYELWSNYENFPRFMSHVVEVRDIGRRRSHWVVQGPAGTQFEFDSVLTEQSKNRRLAWRSEPGAQIPNAGSVEFEPYRGGTRVTVRLSYTPPAGVLGHGLASPRARTRNARWTTTWRA
ncbi:SRPBCC family protein [Massilia sp. Se16.2.3]|uniref:SRPBCC family protein n=1 Tax=Massilia sp. Se16.2.3 TaxID=2709303 RepID=UPI0016021327|nr:SRPBCC family protein [Massilia sp. Se16.2.3]QNB00374.1 SRPBCC family protein [Massilia sp. Se16.2.3]